MEHESAPLAGDPARALDEGMRRGTAVARRTFVFLGALLAAGCATDGARRVASSRLPGPEWPEIPDPPSEPVPPPGAVCVPAKPADAVAGTPAQAEVCYGGPVPFARPRSMWARGFPDRMQMDPMLPPKYVTIHHDGMTPFYGLTDVEARGRLELIRNGHRGKGWGDIGYHYVVDRAGHVWQGRDVLRYQGAHVKDRNEHNIGVMCLGNFVVQKPSSDQVEGLNHVVATLRAAYRIPASNVRTHREWKGAHTACPGDGLQTRVAVLRKSGFRMA